LLDIALRESERFVKTQVKSLLLLLSLKIIPINVGKAMSCVIALYRLALYLELNHELTHSPLPDGVPDPDKYIRWKRDLIPGSDDLWRHLLVIIVDFAEGSQHLI
jgi:hypothetical protein